MQTTQTLIFGGLVRLEEHKFSLAAGAEDDGGDEGRGPAGEVDDAGPGEVDEANVEHTVALRRRNRLDAVFVLVSQKRARTGTCVRYFQLTLTAGSRKGDPQPWGAQKARVTMG